MYDLAVICAVGFAAWQGSQAGALAGGLIGMEMIVSVTVGLLFHELLAGFLGDGLRLALEPFLSPDFPYQGLVVPLGRAPALPLRALRFRFHKGTALGLDEDDSLKPSTVERVAGGLVGGCSGVVIVGAVLLTLSMIPLPAGLRLDPQRMFFDAGGLVLRMAGEFEPDRHEGVSLVVHGEPASRSSDPSAKLVSEPRVAGPDEGSPDEGARFSDVDGNGSFTEDLYFLDLDADQVRRVGLRDKYVVGVWSGALDAHARPRPKPAGASQDSPAPAPPADPADSEAVSPAPGKPAQPGTKPGGTKPGKAPPPVDDF